MHLPQPLTRLMAVVIVMIAAVFGASAAQAHEGHAHRAPAAVKVSHTGTAMVSVPAKTVQVATAKAFAISQTVSTLASGAKASKAPAERPCTGVCCSMGASCCAPSLLHDLTLAPVVLTGGSRLLFAQQPAIAGLPREALPKPPRSFA